MTETNTAAENSSRYTLFATDFLLEQYQLLTCRN